MADQPEVRRASTSPTAAQISRRGVLMTVRNLIVVVLMDYSVFIVLTVDPLSHLLCVGTPQYFNIIPKLPSMTSVWDEKTWTQYAYFPGGGFVSFDDEAAICAKTEYCLDHELGEFCAFPLHFICRI